MSYLSSDNLVYLIVYLVFFCLPACVQVRVLSSLRGDGDGAAWYLCFLPTFMPASLPPSSLLCLCLFCFIRFFSSFPSVCFISPSIPFISVIATRWSGPSEYMLGEEDYEDGRRETPVPSGTASSSSSSSSSSPSSSSIRDPPNSFPVRIDGLDTITGGCLQGASVGAALTPASEAENETGQCAFPSFLRPFSLFFSLLAAPTSVYSFIVSSFILVHVGLSVSLCPSFALCFCSSGCVLLFSSLSHIGLFRSS